MKRILFLLLVSMFVPAFTLAETLATGSGRFEFHQAGKTVPVWYHLPENAKADTPVLIVMHGVKRDAERYRADWLPNAQKHGFLLVVPEFSRAEFPEDADYSQGAVLDAAGKPRAREQTAFAFIEPIFETVKAGTGNTSTTYQIYGHSAGAQFVHRLLYFVPDAHVSKAIAANAGWWTLPDLTLDFPFGMKGMPAASATTLQQMLQRPLIVLLGSSDTDQNDPNLNRSKGAMAQGPFRFARGQNFYQQGQRQAAAMNIPFGWKLGTAPGIGHNDKEMSAFAVEWLFGEKQSTP